MYLVWPQYILVINCQCVLRQTVFIVSGLLAWSNSVCSGPFMNAINPRERKGQQEPLAAMPGHWECPQYMYKVYVSFAWLLRIHPSSKLQAQTDLLLFMSQELLVLRYEKFLPSGYTKPQTSDSMAWQYYLFQLQTISFRQMNFSSDVSDVERAGHAIRLYI